MSVPIGNVIIDYYDALPAVIDRVIDDPSPVKDPAAFSPGFMLPCLDEATRRFFAVARAEWRELDPYDSRHGCTPLTLLDLTRNPGTHTTKTLASLLIVARAVECIRQTGEPIIIFSPTSANKGTALRDAVWRALDAGLAGPEQLRIAILAPVGARDKLRTDPLATDPALRALNPVLIHAGVQPEAVKALGKSFVEEHAARIHAAHGTNVWFSLELRNYIIADAVRAMFEHDVAPTNAGLPRIHAHAVSSAFGLLGYNLGRDLLESWGRADPAGHPGFLLVQHLRTPDMVLSLRHGAVERSRIPAYAIDLKTGLLVQAEDPHFPRATYAADEVLDPTFYTHEPSTSVAMNELIRRYGGDGIVVSLYECLDRYPRLRYLLARSNRPLPADPRQLREWSLAMVLTGAFNALDRGLIPADREVVVHGSGSYSTTDYEPLDAAATIPVTDPEGICRAVVAPQT